MLKKLGVLFFAAALFLAFGPGQASASTAVDISEGGIGDVLLHPLYDVRTGIGNRTDGWQNYFVIENTSGKWTAVHMRFRSWRTSIELYDHIVLLSPYDVFYFTLYVATGAGTTSSGYAYASGDVLMYSDDYETLQNSGFTYAPGVNWLEKFQDFLLVDCGFTAAAGFDLNEEMQAGHFEAIGLWQLRPIAITDAAYAVLDDTHDITDLVDDVYDDGFVGNINLYDILDALYYDFTAAHNIAAIEWGQTPADVLDVIIEVFENDDVLADGIDRYGVDCGNVLCGAVEFGDTGTARYEVTNMIALEDFRTDEAIDNVPALAPDYAAGVVGGAWTALSEDFWTHRDGFLGGAIIHPTDIMRWQVDNTNWYYVNENFATSVGAGLRDGDTAMAAVGGPGLNHQDLAVVPINDYFNDIWSLDDVELILLKDAIWNHYFNLTTAGGATVDTNLVLTFPTKHYHFFFRDWPVWLQDSLASGGGAAQNVGGAGVVYATLSDYWNELANYRDDTQGADADPGDETDLSTIAGVFATTYAYGAVTATAVVFDMEQGSGLPPGGTVPPGSPWTPTAPTVGTIPNEVSIINIGEATGTGINNANWILAGAFAQGQLFLSGITMTNGARAADFGAGPGVAILYNTNAGALPPALSGSVMYQFTPIGIMQYLHSYGAPDVITRSCAEEWHYVPTN